VNTFRRQLTTSFLAPFVAMLLLAGLVLWRIKAQVSITGQVEQRGDVLLVAKDAEVEFREMQAAFRSYMASPDQRYRAELSRARAAFESNLEDVALAVSESPQQERRWVRVIKTCQPTEFDRLLKNASREPPYARLAQADSYSHQLLDTLQSFVAAERQLRSHEIVHQRRLDELLVVLILVFSGVVALSLGYWGWHQIQVAGEQFAEALTNAQEASRAKDNFLGIVSHELRNPLHSILLWCSALLSGQTSDERTRRGLTAIERAARAQAQLIEDLLDISRIERGQLRLDVQTVDLAEVISAAVETIRTTAEAKSVTLETLLDSCVDFVTGDPGRLQQVVWNLVSNAVKFTPKGGKIQVRVQRINSHVEIVVADNGQGIAPRSLPFVFDRFWQAEHRSGASHGIGLGLSIVKQIITLHGGTIAVHSDGLGKGATFTARLPLPVTRAISNQLRRHPTVAPLTSATGAQRLDGASILAVDDEPGACEALKNLLASLGANVVTVTSAEAALAMLDKLHPDAVVSDLGMPLRDGYFLAKALRERELNTGARMPLVALTAYGRIEDKVQTLAAGFDSHLIKPVDAVELAAVLRNLITSRAA
jgi:signal transduction histidine kinase/ActR/RegA family two-component response regulator